MNFGPLSLTNSLIKRELGNASALPSFVENKMRDHMMRDLFTSYALSLGEEWNLGQGALKVTRERDWIAFGRSERLVVYDLVGRRKIWSCLLDKKNEFDLIDIKLSETGIMLAVTKEGTAPNKNPNLEVHIFFQAVKTKCLSLTMDHLFLNTLTIKNDRVIALTHNARMLSVWDKEGLKIKEVALQFFSDYLLHYTSSHNFYVLGSPCTFQNHSKLFVYPLKGGKKTVLIFNGKEFTTICLDAIDLHKNWLFCAYSLKKQLQGTEIDPMIVTFDLNANKILNRTFLEDKRGKISYIKGNEHYIFYLIEKEYAQNTLWLLDQYSDAQDSDVQNFILTIPYAADSASLRVEFFGALVHVLYAVHPSSTELYVIDPKELTIVKKVTYHSFNEENRSSFQDGRLLLVDHQSENPSIYVEDFTTAATTTVSPSEKQKWKRTCQLTPPDDSSETF